MRNKTAVLITLGYFLCAGGASAQLVSVGVKGGVAITDPGNYNDESRRYIVGPSVEFRLPFRFAAEVDALYSRLGQSFNYNYTDPQTGISTASSVRDRANSWEFPVLGKYYFGSDRKLQPFLGTGYSFRSTWATNTVQTSVLSPAPIPPALFVTKGSYRSTVDIGAVFAGGVRWRMGRVSVLPEFRYTRHNANTTWTRRGEGKFLLGISF